MIEAWQVLDTRYELGEVLGTGGMAEVRRARDVRLGREVAVKMLRGHAADDPALVEAFRSEAMASARLSHPGVVAVYDVGEAEVDGHIRAYLVMEMIEGMPLSSLLVDGTALTVERSVEIGVDVCGALAHAHERGVIHRDVTPANLMILPTGAVKVTDFGIARAVRTGASRAEPENDAGAGYGSVAYISPEQARRRTVDARSDLYSFGCVLMEMLTGAPPFRGTPAAVVAAHLATPAPVPSTRRPGIDPAIDEVVLRCLAKDPWARPQTAAELRRDLLRILVEVDSSAARAAAVGGLASASGDGIDITELPTARVASGLLPLDTGPLPVMGTVHSADRPGDPTQRAATAPAVTVPAVTVPAVTVPAVTAPAATAADGAGAIVRDRMADRAGVARRSWWVLLVAALLGVVALIVGGVLRVGGGPGGGDVEVPPTTGRSVEAATVALEALDLTVAVEPRPEDSTEIPRDAVIRTEPGEGERVARRAEVVLVISSGPAAVTVPELEGLSLSAALLVLEAAGLAAGDLEVRDSSEPQDQVLSSVPEFGQVLDEGEAVSLVIGSGSNVVPRVVGFDRGRAADLLVDQGFAVVVDTVPTDLPDGTVIEVRPAPGVRQAVGTTITLVLARSATTGDPTAAEIGEPTSSATQTATVTVTATETRGSGG